ncbi:MAG: hypothetical protein HYR62_04565 [Actinobacteria bacterium]|nr:hypothetical protein [Actinomycetota bacterium]MBI3686508.1 hypothetical protein [Actinomycetota bacterium]
MNALDPLAELARLRDPAGPWLHLLWGATSDARQLGWMLAQPTESGPGLVSRVLRGQCIRTRYGLFDEVGAALQFPGDVVEGWPDLGALLADLSWLPGPGHVLVVTRAALLLAAAPRSDLAAFVTVTEDVAAARQREGAGPLHIVFAEDAVGLAVLRARLTAVGGVCRDIPGWLPEEPSGVRSTGGRTAFVPRVRAVDPDPADPLLAGTDEIDEIYEIDEIDAAVVASVSGFADGTGGIIGLRRGWETYHGPVVDPVRTYGVLLDRPDLAVPVADAIGRAVAPLAMGGCVVLPMPAGGPESDPQLDAFLAGSTALWSASGTASAEPLAEDVPEPPAVQPDASAEPGDNLDPPFELVAADLAWPFHQGSQELDEVDRAALEVARGGDRLMALFRTWTRDPVGGWVRVVMGYVGPGASADSVRPLVVAAVQRAGARRTCVEIVNQPDIGEAHRWLEGQCRSLWHVAEPPIGSGPEEVETDAVTAFGRAELDAEVADPRLSELAERLVSWASQRAGVLGLVAAWAGPPRESPLVIGVVLDGDVEEAPLRVEVEEILADRTAGAESGQFPAPDELPEVSAELFAPSRGLSATHLRLYRNSSRVWTRRTERPVRPASAADGIPAYTGPRVDLTSPDLGEAVEVKDEAVGDTLVLVGLNHSEATEAAPDEPDAADDAVVAWAQDRPELLGVVRAGVRREGDLIPAYLLAVDSDADRTGVRQAAGVALAELAGPAADGGSAPLARVAVEVFCPTERIPLFYLELFNRGRVLWRGERRVGRPTGSGAAGGVPTPSPEP